MLFEIKKAFEALAHPGIDTNYFRLMRNALPYYISAGMNVPPPLTIYWSVNSICNMRCRMCDVGNKKTDGTFYKNLAPSEKNAQIDIEVFRSVIDEIAPAKPVTVFNSTEPLLYRPIAEAVEYSASKRLKTVLTTNGYMLPERAAELAGRGLTRLNVSIDGPEKVHNEIRGRSDVFQKATNGIKIFREMDSKTGGKTEITVNCTISDMNYPYLEEYVKEMQKLPIDRIILFHLWFVDEEMAREHNETYGDRFPVSESCNMRREMLESINIDIMYEQLSKIEKYPEVSLLQHLSRGQLEKFYHRSHEFLNTKSQCMASWFFAQILADGSVMPFTRCPNQSFGNINKKSFLEIWNGAEIKNWRHFIKKHKKMPVCKRCDLIY